MPASVDRGPIIVPIEKLQIKHAVGEGSTGSVHYAKHEQWGEVAVKLLQTTKPGLAKKDRRKLETEAEKLRGLSHKHIVQLYGVVYEPECCGLVMQYMPKGSLSQFVKNYDIPVTLKMKFGYEIILGMNYLHTLEPPVIHRDLKCLNVLIADDLSAKISDFGLAVWRGITRSHSSSKLNGTTPPAKRRAGTPAYIPPESWADVGRQPDQKFDIYAYGILLYEMLSENEPYENVTSLDHLIYAVKEGQRPSADDVPDTLPELKQIMQQCWQNDPQNRPSFSDMKAAIEPVYENQHKTNVNKAMLNIFHQMQEEESEKQSSLAQSNGSSNPSIQPLSCNDKSETTYPPLHDIRMINHNVLEQNYSDSSTVPVLSSESDSQKAVVAPTDDKPKLPSVLTGPNVPAPNYWPSNLAGSASGSGPGSVPLCLRNDHLVLNGGSVEADCLNKPYPNRTYTPQDSGLSNIAVASDSNPNLSDETNSSENTSYPETESSYGLLEAGGNPGRAADGSFAGLRTENPNRPVPRFTVTDPKAVDYGANTKLLDDNFAQLNIREGKIQESTSEETSKPAAIPREPELLSNPTQETSAPSSSQITTDAVPFFDHKQVLFSDNNQTQEITKGVILHPKDGHLSMRKQGPDGKVTVLDINNLGTMQIGDNNVTHLSRVPHTGATPTNVVQPQLKKKLKVPARMIDRKDIQIVAQELGKSWKELARKLQFSTGQIDAIEHDYHLDGLHEMIHQLLEQWKMKKKDQASVKNLLVNLIEIGRPDIATKIATDVQTLPIG